MVRVPVNKTYEKQQNKLIASTFKKGIIVAVHKESWSADIQIVGGSQTVIRNIPFAGSVDVSKVQKGNKCRIDLFDESNPNDMVIAYTYGSGNAGGTGTQFAHGSQLVSTSGSSIAHGLGAIPDIVIIVPNEDYTSHKSNSVTVGGTPYSFNDYVDLSVYEYQNADINNIYLQSSTVGAATCKWYAIKF